LADLRDRCIILSMVAAGIRVGAIPSLRVSSLLKVDEGVGFLTVYPQSSYKQVITARMNQRN
jgi:hypothetical protein